MPTPLPHKQIIKKRTLKFPRYQSDEQIKVKSSWRRPRGIDSRHRCRYVLPPPLEPCLRQRFRAGQGRAPGFASRDAWQRTELSAAEGLTIGPRRLALGGR